MILKHKDFRSYGTQGKSIEAEVDAESARKPSPCEGCEHRQRCKNEVLACERYKYFCKDQTYYQPVSYYMDRPCWPNKRDWKAVWGDYDPSPDRVVTVKPKPRAMASREEVREALDAAQEAYYPPLPEIDIDGEYFQIKNILGTYRQWRGRQDKIILTLRAKLEEMQAAV